MCGSAATCSSGHTRASTSTCRRSSRFRMTRSGTPTRWACSAAALTGPCSNRYNSRVQATTPLSVGVIGTGRMGRLHTRVYGQMPQVKLVGVYDSNIEAAQEAAEQYDTRAFADLDELLSQVAAVT